MLPLASRRVREAWSLWRGCFVGRWAPRGTLTSALGREGAARGCSRSLCLQSRPRLSQPPRKHAGPVGPASGKPPLSPGPRRLIQGAPMHMSLWPARSGHPGSPRPRARGAFHARMSPGSPEGVQVSLLWERGCPPDWDHHKTPGHAALWPGGSGLAPGAAPSPPVNGTIALAWLGRSWERRLQEFFREQGPAPQFRVTKSLLMMKRVGGCRGWCGKGPVSSLVAPGGTRGTWSQASRRPLALAR